MNSVIAIDLGSNSIRFLKLDCNTKKIISHFNKTVKTADRLNKTGVISKEAIDRIVNAINITKNIINFNNSKIKAVTTEAIRKAKNSQEVITIIEQRTGIRFEIIDGKQEANYTLIATQNRLKLLNKNPNSFMLIDIGGASTEVIFSYQNGNKIIDKSFSIGIVTLTQSFNSLDDISNAIVNIMSPIREFISDIYSKYNKPELFIATAGTPTTIAAMKIGLNYNSYGSDKIHGTILTKEDLIEQFNRLLSMSPRDRVKTVGIGRDDLIASGVLIYNELYNISGFDSSIVIDDGVREGVALSECEKFR